MADINVRSDSVDVEQIMRHIRARIREKRGADYTEDELQQLASVKLQEFLDPKGVRSDLVAAFRKHRTPSAPMPNYAFEDTTLFDTHRGLLKTIRRLLRPVLKLFFNPNTLSDALNIQAKVNTEVQRQLAEREALDPLFFEVIHNLVVETTRLGIEVQNVKMRVESLSSRLDFDERRAKALETVVEYKPGAGRPKPEATADTDEAASGPKRKRRRRRRRRPGQTGAEAHVAAGSTPDGNAGVGDEPNGNVADSDEPNGNVAEVDRNGGNEPSAEADTGSDTQAEVDRGAEPQADTGNDRQTDTGNDGSGEGETGQ